MLWHGPSPQEITTTDANVLSVRRFLSGNETVLRESIRSRSQRILQRQPGRERHADLADQRHALDFRAAGEIAAGKAAGDLPASEDKRLADRFGVLIDGHVATPLSVPERVAAGVVEIAVAAHDASVAEHDHAPR